MTIVGAFARIDMEDPAVVRERLASLGGVELFELGEPGKVGLMLESETVDDAHSMVRRLIGRVEGVLGVWPVYVHDHDDDDHEDEDEDNTEERETE